MSLINCPECGKEISSKANSCPNCGNINKKTNVNSSSIKTGTIVSLIANSLIIILIITFIIISLNATESSESKGGLKVNVYLTAKTLDGISLLCFLLSILLALFNFILTTLFLCNKINKIKRYKFLLLILSIAQLFCSLISIIQLICCGVVYSIFPLINFIGAIVVATGKANENI